MPGQERVCPATAALACQPHWLPSSAQPVTVSVALTVHNVLVKIPQTGSTNQESIEYHLAGLPNSVAP